MSEGREFNNLKIGSNNLNLCHELLFDSWCTMPSTQVSQKKNAGKNSQQSTSKLNSTPHKNTGLYTMTKQNFSLGCKDDSVYRKQCDIPH